MPTRVPIALLEEWLSMDAAIRAGTAEVAIRFVEPTTSRGFEIVARREGQMAVFDDPESPKVNVLGGAHHAPMMDEDARAIVRAFSAAAGRQARGLTPFVNVRPPSQDPVLQALRALDAAGLEWERATQRFECSSEPLDDEVRWFNTRHLDL